MQRSEQVPTKRNRVAPTVILKQDAPGVVKVDISGDVLPLSDAVGSDAVLVGLLKQLSALGSPGKAVDVTATNFALGLVDSMAPRDATEALLLSQMAAVHQATMMMAKRLNQSDNLLQQDSAGRALTKLARTFAGQVEALKRYRSEIQQRVRVEHVTVEAGGQAVVGNVVTGGAANRET